MRICTLSSHTSSMRRLFCCPPTVSFSNKNLTVGIMAGKAAPKKQNNRANPISKKAKEDKPIKEKNPKDSHLYTDDNPETTLKGTGFKDVTTAKNTSKCLREYSFFFSCVCARQESWTTCSDTVINQSDRWMGKVPEIFLAHVCSFG